MDALWHCKHKCSLVVRLNIVPALLFMCLRFLVAAFALCVFTVLRAFDCDGG